MNQYRIDEHDCLKKRQRQTRVVVTMPFISVFKNRNLLFLPSVFRIRNYQPSINIRFENNKYIVKTVENSKEFKEVLLLRHKVFYEEILSKKRRNRIDIDAFDFVCDHLVVFDKAMRTIIGTYRLNSSLNTRRFYSATEFSIRNITSLEGNKLEIGRACILREHRNNFVVAMLWKGLSEYIKQTDTKLVFGCSSIKTTNIHEIARIYKYLWLKYGAAGHLLVYPKGKYRIRDFQMYVNTVFDDSTQSSSNFEKQLPPLLRFYLKAGAVICGEPVIDKHFRCTDFFTLLDMNKLNKRIEQKFCEAHGDGMIIPQTEPILG